jgi:hypothetical protein
MLADFSCSLRKVESATLAIFLDLDLPSLETGNGNKNNEKMCRAVVNPATRLVKIHQLYTESVKYGQSYSGRSRIHLFATGEKRF